MANGRRDQWIDNVFHQRIYDCGECCTDDYGDSEVDDVAAQNKFAKAFKHCEAPLFRIEPIGCGVFPWKRAVKRSCQHPTIAWAK
jgi:hypothetical protein